MVKKIKEMKVERKLKYCFTLVVIIASFSGVLGVLALILCNTQSVSYTHLRAHET